MNEIERSINQEGENEGQAPYWGNGDRDHLAKIDDIAYIRLRVCIVNLRPQMFLKELGRMSMIGGQPRK